MTCQKTWSGTENKVHIDHNKRKEMHGVIIKRLQKTHGLSAQHGTHTRIDRRHINSACLGG